MRIEFPRGRASILLLVFLTTSPNACGDETPEETSQEQPPPAPTRDPNEPGVHPLGGNRYQIVIRAFVGGFSPAEVRVPAGADVSFRVLSEDLPHGFAIERAALEVELQPNAYVEARHTFAEPGEYPFHCHVYCGGGHETMHGKVIVEAP